ncbi:hypothetical protein AGMMS49942_26800 [Spirochaetia bacterium]|nr:hypothetical protein AGMMS49942_26800 [Spirochaetia bacterium]
MSMVEERVREITGRWYMREPLLLMTLLSHRLEPNDKISTLRSGKGRIEYNPAYMESLSGDELEAKLKTETFRLLLRHPYRQAKRNDPVLSYLASNITLNECYTFPDLPHRSADYWEGEEYRKQNFEFYYRELKKIGEDTRNNDEGEGEEETELWDDDDYMDQKMKGLITQAVQSKSWGSLSGVLVETLIAGLRPVLDYRKVLRGFRAMVLSSDKILTRTKQSRRYSFLYMGRKNQFTTRLLLGVDVSGSISTEEINLFYSAVNRFFHYGVIGLEVLQFDTEIKGTPELMKKARKTIEVTGRGGTDFQSLINYFAEHDKQYDGLIIFTDGFAVIPKVSRGIARKILWICNNKANYERHHGWMTRQGRCCWID